MAAKRRPLIAHTWLNAVPAVLVAVGLVYIAIGLWQLGHSTNAPAAKKQESAAAANPDAQKLKEQLDKLQKQVDGLAQNELKNGLDSIAQQAAHNQSLLSILLAVAGLFTLAQGVYAFFSAQNYMNQVAALMAEVRTKYPMLSLLEEALEAAFRRLADLADRLYRYQNLYTESDPITRQEILALEGFAATQFLAFSVRGPQVLANLRLLGYFYAGKFDDGRRAVKGDFERALYYFSLELDKSSHDILALNDLGWLYMEVAATRDKDKARGYFLESLRINSDQQRPNYNLGTMAFDAKQLDEAREYLEKAARIRNWEVTPNDDFAGLVHYNLACTYSRLSEHEPDAGKKAALLDLATGALERAADRAGTDASNLEEDLQTKDLAALGQSPIHAVMLSVIREKFRKAWAERTRTR